MGFEAADWTLTRAIPSSLHTIPLAEHTFPLHETLPLFGIHSQPPTDDTLSPLAKLLFTFLRMSFSPGRNMCSVMSRNESSETPDI